MKYVRTYKSTFQSNFVTELDSMKTTIRLGGRDDTNTNRIQSSFIEDKGATNSKRRNSWAIWDRPHSIDIKSVIRSN